MNVTLRTPLMTREQFLDWVERQEAPFEFDGYKPVPMTGGTRLHSRLCQNLYLAVGTRLAGSKCEFLPEAGIATLGSAVRYPDALITCSDGPVEDRLMPDPLVVFEIVSPSSARNDHITKFREYSAVPSIRRYVIVEHSGPDILVYSRHEAEGAWTAVALTTDDSLDLPEVGIEVPVNELYRGITFAADDVPTP